MKPMIRGSYAGALTLLALLMSGYSNSCNPHGDDCDAFFAQDDDGRVPQLVIGEESLEQLPHDGWALGALDQQCDALYLQVSYSGGCAEHEFELRAQPWFKESFPVQADIWLSHNANGDMCEAYPTEDQVYDLTPLRKAYLEAYGSEDVIRVNLLGADGRLLETFEYDLAAQ